MLTLAIHKLSNSTLHLILDISLRIPRFMAQIAMMMMELSAGAIILVDSIQLKDFPPRFLSRCDLQRIIRDDGGELCISVRAHCRSLGAHRSPQKHLVVRSMEL